MVERGTGWGAANPRDPPPLPPVPVLYSERSPGSGAGGAESGGRAEGEILLI